MTKLCDQDEKILQQFYDYLRARNCFCPDEALALLRTILEEYNLNTLADLDYKTVERLYWTEYDSYEVPRSYDEDERLNAIWYLVSFLYTKPRLDPANEAFVAQHFDEVLPIHLETLLRSSESIMYGFHGGHIHPCLHWLADKTPLAIDKKTRGLPSPKILFRSRKKKKTKWLDDALGFIEAYHYKGGLTEPKELQDTITGILAADDNRSDDAAIRVPLSQLLKDIEIETMLLEYPEPDEDDEEYQGTLPEDPDWLDKAGEVAHRLLKDLKSDKTRLIEVLTGEYIAPESQNDGMGTIVLYLANIVDFAKENGFDQIFIPIERAYAHQYFLYHFDQRARSASQTLAGLNDYFPGEIVKESLASYFSWNMGPQLASRLRQWYPREYKEHALLSKIIKRSWRGKSVRHCPEVGAARIRDEEHFKEILRIAFSDPNGLYRAAYELLK